MANTKTEVVRLRVTPELKTKIRELADEENRTISNYLEMLIKNEIEKKGG